MKKSYPSASPGFITLSDGRQNRKTDTMWLRNLLRRPAFRWMAPLVKRIAPWAVPDETPGKTPLERTLEELKDRLSREEAPARVEQWFVGELMRLIDGRRKRKSPDEGAEESRLQRPGRVFLANFCNSRWEARRIRNSFITLKEKYRQQGATEKALKMLRLAAVFGALPPEEKKWAFSAIRENGLNGNGYWLGEAAVESAKRNPDPNCIDILRTAGENGNELARFILKCKETQ